MTQNIGSKPLLAVQLSAHVGALFLSTYSPSLQLIWRTDLFGMYAEQVYHFWQLLYFTGSPSDECLCIMARKLNWIECLERFVTHPSSMAATNQDCYWHWTLCLARKLNWMSRINLWWVTHPWPQFIKAPSNFPKSVQVFCRHVISLYITGIVLNSRLDHLCLYKFCLSDALYVWGKWESAKIIPKLPRAQLESLQYIVFTMHGEVTVYIWSPKLS